MTTTDTLELGRGAVARQAWGEAYARLTAADRARPLEVADLERLALAAHMNGHVDDAARAWERAHLAALQQGEPLRAVRHAFHLIMGFGLRGDVAQAGGWLARATRLAEEADPDSVERGLLFIPEALYHLERNEPALALELFERVSARADRSGDPDLTTLGRLGRGQSTIALGDTDRGVALLDEAMVSVATGEVSPTVVGIVYCASIEAYVSLFDLRRAQEWTEALSRWCDAQDDLVPFRGRCLVYRAELMQFHGRWRDADVEARRAHDWLSRPPIEPALGEAHYQQAELHRLRGDYQQAETDYREASRWGRRPEPGLALLRSAQGDQAAATASIRRAVDEADEMTRPRLLEPLVEILLAGGERSAARDAADRLIELAAISGAPLLAATAARADGRVRLAEGDPRAALATLRRAWSLWQGLDAPYDAARVRVLIGLACREIGDMDAAGLEFDAARRTFRELGAAPDLARLDALAGSSDDARPGGLSPREIEVLRAVAAGRTNREIGAELGLSERTIDRHVSNIYTKLGISSRAAATAYAIEHGLR
ncbi:MAG TPA: LuxR C-terminal-related transcriptional regulator [Candidatus Limnocylindrales bacterium]|nr:LuxR C-terminal-related transcriptional regulator [Candidatus Limnocylindrales bacterium]